MAAPSKRVFEVFVSKIPWTIAASEYTQLFILSAILGGSGICMLSRSFHSVHGVMLCAAPAALSRRQTASACEVKAGCVTETVRHRETFFTRETDVLRSVQLKQSQGASVEHAGSLRSVKEKEIGRNLN